MEEAFLKGNFKLEDINQDELYSLVDLIRKHKGQNKKNQKAIKDLVVLLLNKYSILLDEEEVEKFTSYFKITIKKEISEKESKSNIGLIAASVATSIYSQEILDIFSQGTLF
jgi:sucrose-6-phosphate hydrolase SacC (GH32 family)